MADSPCNTEDGIVHVTKDTGQTGTNPNTGDEYKVYRCPCGQVTDHVYK